MKTIKLKSQQSIMAGKNSDDKARKNFDNKVRCFYFKGALFTVGVVMFFYFFVTALDNFYLHFDDILLYMPY